jgi:hypothetical protein
MAFVVTCGACGKRLNIPDQLFDTKIRGRIVTIGCKQCRADIRVDGTDPSAYQAVESVAPPPVEPSGSADSHQGAGAPAVGAPAEPSTKETKSAPRVEQPSPPVSPGSSPVLASGATPKEPKSAPRIEKPVVVPAADAALDALGSWSLPPPPGEPMAVAMPVLAPAPPVTGRQEAKSAPRLQPPPAPPAAPSEVSHAVLPAPATAPEPAPSFEVEAAPLEPGAPLAMKEHPASPRFEKPEPSPTVTPRVAAKKELKSAPRLPPPAARQSGSRPGGGLPSPREMPKAPPTQPMGLAPTAPMQPAASPGAPSPAAPGLAGGLGDARGFASARGAAAPKTDETAATPTLPTESAGGMGTVWAVSFSDSDDRELTLPDILKALRAGQISTESLVWREGMAGWLPLSRVPELKFYLDALTDDEPTRLKRPEDMEALKRRAGVLPNLVPAPAPFARQVHSLPSEAENLESLPPDVLRTLSEPPEVIDPASPELIDSVPPFSPPSDFQAGALPITNPFLAHAPEPAAAPRAPATSPVVRIAPAGPAAFSLPASLPPELKRRLPVSVIGIVVSVLLGGAVLALVVGLARRPQEPEVVVPTTTVDSPSAAPARTDAEPGPSATMAPGKGEAQGLDLVAAIEKSLGKGPERAGAAFDRKIAQNLLGAAAGRAAACRREGDEKGPADVVVTFEPSGRVIRAEVRPPYEGTGTGKCIALTFEALRMRPFAGGSVALPQRVMIR